MSNILNVLIIEDSEDDTLLLIRELKRGGYTPVYQRIDTPEDMIKALETKVWDIIISDYSMPRFNGIKALEILKEKGLDIPFIIVSGAIGEDLAVLVMKAGANDYLIKDNIKRLIPAIERELREANVRMERKKAEKALHESEHSYRTLSQNLPGIIYRVFLKEYNRIQFFNDMLEPMTGYKISELMDGDVFSIDKLIVREDRNIVIDTIKQAITEDKPFQIEYKINCKQGDIRYFFEKGRPVRGDDGHPLFIDSVILDITERKRAEESLHNRIALEEMVTTISTHFIKLSLDEIDRELNWALKIIGEFCNVDHSYISLLNHDETTIKYIYEWCRENMPSRIGNFKGISLLPFSWMMGKLKNFEVIYVSHPKYFPSEAQAEKEMCLNAGITSLLAFPLKLGNNLIGFFGLDSTKTEKIWKDEDIKMFKMLGEIFINIFEKKKTEEFMKLNEDRMEVLFRLSQLQDSSKKEITDFVLEEGIRLTKSQIGYLAFTNEDETVLDLHSWSKNALKTCNIENKYYTYKVEETGLWGEAIRQRKPVITNDYRTPNPYKKGYPEGHIDIIRHMNVPIFDGNHIVAVVGVGNKEEPYDETDILHLTLLADNMWKILQKKNSDESLRFSEARNRALLNAIPDLMFLLDKGGRFLDYNAPNLDTLYAKPENFLNKTIREVLPEELTERLELSFKETLKTKKIRIFEYSLPVNDAIRYFEARILACNDDNIIVIIRDITERKLLEGERKKLEGQLQHSQKLESLGVLAGGIAHDFNNILTGILGYADLALVELSPVSPARDYINQIVQSSHRAADLTKQMLAYSGKGKFIIQAIKLSELVQEMSHLLEVSISKKCALKYYFDDSLPDIEGDPTQIRQVVMNLITNASEAIGDRNGIITIRTGVMECDTKYLSDSYIDEELPGGKYVYLEVSDTGCGMTKETISKIFDPFFTTKFTGRGLGLAAVIGIMRGHKGAIKIYSEVGQGTTFKVLFPINSNLSETQKVKRDKNLSYTGDKGTVLIVDDEKTVRTIAKSMLVRSGFEVLTAADGEECLEIFRKEGENIQVIILDMTMPNMDGEETFKELRHMKEDVKVILSSGYNEQDAMTKFIGKGLSGFIQKPYTIKDLMESIRKAM